MAIRQCGIDHVFLNFVNYIPSEKQAEFIDHVNSLTGVSVNFLGFGPTVSDVFELPHQTDLIKLVEKLNFVE